MARDESPLFETEQTLWEGDAANISTADFNYILGKEWRVEDPAGTGEYKTIRAVRAHTSTLGAKDTVKFQAGNLGTDIDGFAASGQECAVMDDLLVNNVSLNDICYVVTAGPVNVVTKAASPQIAAGAVIASAGSGRVKPAAAGDFALGVAIDSATTSQTDTTIRALIGPKYARDYHG